jgi:hypothetical protein
MPGLYLPRWCYRCSNWQVWRMLCAVANDFQCPCVLFLCTSYILVPGLA